jgi:hypothetical protein
MKTLLHLLPAVLVTFSAWAVPNFDSFSDSSGSGGTSYDTGGNLVGQNNGNLSWYLRGGNNSSGTQPVIEAGNLAYPNMPASSGKSVSIVPSTGQTACVDLSLATGGHVDTVYYSCFLKITDLSTVPTVPTENPIVFFIDDTSTTISGNTIARRGARLLTRKISSTTYVLGTGKTSSTNGFIYESSAHNVGDVLFVVGSYQRSGTSTNVYLWVNPASESFGTSTPPTPTLVAPVVTAPLGLNVNNARGLAVSCQFPAAPTAVIDEVRVATDWAYVTGGDPAITQNPANVSAPEGGTAVFSVVARGTPTLTYQWVKDGSITLSDGGNISGATTDTLTVSGVSSADVGTYSVIVNNGNANSVTSGAATLALADPAITAQPQSRTNNFGTIATFQVTASGTAPFDYQWVKEGVGDLTDVGNVSGSQTATLTLTGVSAADAGNYSVRVSNGVSTSDSTSAALVVRDPYIMAQPVSVSEVAGADVNFSVTVDGSGQPFSYQWQKNGSSISDDGTYSGTSSDILTVSNISSAEEANYSVIVTSSVGTATSSSASLTVVTPLTITAQPVSRTVTAGSKATFAVGVAGSGPLSHEWRRNGTPIPDANGFAYTVTNAQIANEGGYSVVVSGPINAVTSSVAALTITANASLTVNNVAVIRVGDGAQSLTANGNSMAIDVFAGSGSYVSTVNIPDTGANAMITMGPNLVPTPSSVTGTTMSRSADGRFLVVAGYNTEVGYGTTLNTASATAVPRGIGFIDTNGQYTLALASTDTTFNATFWRSAVADGTNNFWGSARGPGTYYFGFDQSAALIQNTFANIRSMGLFNGSIYCVSAVAGNSGVLKLDGMPTTGSAPTSLLFAGTTGFSDLDVSPGGTLIYVADDRVATGGGGIQRWEYDGSNWNKIYTITNELANGARYITANFNSGNPVIYVATKEIAEDNNRLVKIVDTGAESTGVTMAYAGVNQNFRGLRLGATNGDLPGAVSVARAGNTVTITWEGGHTLQSATDPAGTYDDVIGADSPHSVDVNSATQLFFRLRQ